MLNPTVIDLDGFDSVVITRNGKVVGFVEVQRERNGNVELLANPVICSGDWDMPPQEVTFNSFATTMATNVRNPENAASVEKFIAFMKIAEMSR